VSAWLALLEQRPDDAELAATADEQVLAGWRSSDETPHPAARRVDPRLLDPDGAPAWVSLLWPDREVLPLFDDPAVLAARRAALIGPAPRAVSTMVIDSTHFAGSIWVVSHPSELRDDPFHPLGSPILLQVGAGLLGSAPRSSGPALERCAGAPWPDDGTCRR